MKKTLKLFMSLVVMAIVFLGFNECISAEDIEVYSKEYLKGIRSLDKNVDTTFYMLSTTDGNLVYCVKSNSNPPINATKYYYLTTNDSIKSKVPGLISIINDSKNNSIMKNNSGQVLPERENYYVTQFAVWYYLEGTNGLLTGEGVKWIQSSRYSNAFNALLNNAKNATVRNPKLTIVSKDGGNVSSDMSTVDGSNIMISDTVFMANFSETSDDNQDYKVVLPNSDGVKSYLTNEDGTQKYGKEHTFGANEGFRVAIDTSYVTNEKSITVQFNVTNTVAESKDDLRVYTAYQGTAGLQDVTLVKSTPVNLSADFSVKTTVNKKHEVKVVKVNSKGEKLEGAVIGIFDADGNKVTQVTSKKDAQTVSLIAGNYYIQEISAPAGYILNTAKVEFSIAEDGTLKDSKGQVIKDKSLSLENNLPTIEIEKVNEKQIPVKGAKIVICDYNKETKEESNCNFEWITDGKVKKLTIGTDFGSIKDGSYIIKEVSAPHGFELSDPKIITVKDGQLSGDLTKNKVTIVDITYLDVSKTDATGQNEIAGAQMKLYDKTGKLVEEWESTTSEHRIKGLEIGEVYEIVEELAPEGYIPLSTSIKFRITDEGKVETLDCLNNDNEYGAGFDAKSCKVMSSEEILKIKNEVTQIKISKIDITNEKEMEGAKLQILTADGKPVYQDGKLLEWISGTEKDENGNPMPHYIKMLPVGDYKLIETFTPAGYSAVSNEVNFTVKPESGIQTVVFKNAPTKVVISKKDFTTGKEIEGATLQILNEDGTPVYQNGELLKWVSTSEEHVIDMLPVGKYILVEVLPANGYKSDMVIDGMLTSKYNFEVKDSGVVRIDVYNEVIGTPITGLDVSSTYVIGSAIVLLGIGTITFGRKKFEA